MTSGALSSGTAAPPPPDGPTPHPKSPYAPPTNYFSLLLSDSALPLGSFAFSSGLESYTAHRRHTSPRETVSGFLSLSLHSLSHSALPYVLAAHSSPERAAALDDEFDASTTCVVARRASTSQGRALLTVYERAFAAVGSGSGWVEAYKRSSRGADGGEVVAASGHFPVAWGVVCRALEVAREEAGFLFLLAHVKGVLSAAVRLSLVGPYHAQAVLASAETRRAIEAALEVGKGIGVEMAGQTVPTFDVYQGRHELLYSRVFNS